MKFSSILMIMLLAASISACEKTLDQRYLDAAPGQALELPPDLMASNTESKFELPAVFSGDDETVRNKVPTLAKVDSVELRSQDGFYWLQVDEPVEQLYQLVKDYWGAEGYRLIVDEPVIGIMQTDWVFKEEGVNRPNTSWWERLFVPDDLSASQDQFRTRIARDPEGNGSRVYIAHRGTDFKYVLDTKAAEAQLKSSDGNLWTFRRPEPELEIEKLSRLMIFLGLKKAEVDRQLADIKMFAPRAFMHIDADENSPYMILKHSYDIAWNRLYHELERMNFEIVAIDEKSGISGEGAITVRAKTNVAAESDGGFFSFFASNDGPKDREFVLVVEDENHQLTRVLIETKNGKLDTSPEGAQLLSLLYQQIR